MSLEAVKIEPVKMNTDARGAVFEPVNDQELVVQRNSHVVLSEPGAIRGNHYHPVGREITVVVGPCLVRYRDVAGNGSVQEVEIPAGTARRFTFPPGVAHAFRNPGPGVMILASFNSEVHDPGKPDQMREVLI